MLRVHGGAESKLPLSLAECWGRVTGPRLLATGISRALQGAHLCPWLRSPEEMSSARTPCTCAFRSRAVSGPGASPASSSQSSRSRLIVLALLWELDSSRAVISTKHAPSDEWIHMRLRLVALDRWCADPAASVCQNYPNFCERLGRAGDLHTVHYSRWTGRGNAQLRELDAITSSQMLLRLLV